MESKHLVDRIKLLVKNRDYIKDQLHYGSAHFNTEVKIEIDNLIDQYNQLIYKFKEQCDESVLKEFARKHPEVRH
jgi:hypothetical protein